MSVLPHHSAGLRLFQAVRLVLELILLERVSQQTLLLLYAWGDEGLSESGQFQGLSEAIELLTSEVYGTGCNSQALMCINIFQMETFPSWREAS